MKKTKFVRLLALCLAAVSLIGIVGALSYDRNGDNKVNVWDLQLMVNEGASEEELNAVVLTGVYDVESGEFGGSKTEANEGKCKKHEGAYIIVSGDSVVWDNGESCGAN